MMRTIPLLFFAFAVFGSIHARGAGADEAVEKLFDTPEMTFAIGLKFVGENPSDLALVGLLAGEKEDAVRNVRARLTGVKPVDLTLSRGEIHLASKATGLRVLAYRPKLVIGFKGASWTDSPSEPMDRRLESFHAFLQSKGFRSARWSSLLPQAHADVVDDLRAKSTDDGASKGAGWGIGGAILGGALAGPKGALLLGVLGYLAGKLEGGPGSKEDAICKMANSKEGREKLMSFEGLTFQCTTAKRPLSPGEEKDLNILFGEGARSDGFRIFYSPSYGCCDVERTSHRTDDGKREILKFGKINQADYDIIKKTMGDCKEPAKANEEMKARLRVGLARLLNSPKFCDKAGTSKLQAPKARVPGAAVE